MQLEQVSNRKKPPQEQKPHIFTAIGKRRPSTNRHHHPFHRLAEVRITSRAANLQAGLLTATADFLLSLRKGVLQSTGQASLWSRAAAAGRS